MKIEISKHAMTGEIQVWQDGATSGILTVGEMVEQIFSLLKIEPKSPYPMKTPAEWESRRRAPLHAR